MDIIQICRAAGGVIEVAKRPGITRGAIYNWQGKGVPAKRLVKLERITGIGRSLIRPDLYKE